GADHLAGRQEGQLDGVVEPAAAETLDVAPVGAAAPDPRGEALEPLSLAGLHLVAVPAVGPVESTVGPEEGPVNVAAVAVEVEVTDQRLALAGLAALALLEAPQAGVRGGVDGAVVPEDARGEGEVVGEGGGLVEDAVSVGILE